MVVERGCVEVLRRGELPHLLPPLREQSILLLLDQGCQLCEIPHHHSVLQPRGVVSHVVVARQWIEQFRLDHTGVRN